MRTTSRTISAALLSAILLAVPVAASAAPAAETPPVTLEGIQASAAQLIDGRLGAIETAMAAATANSYLTESHRAAIGAILADDASGLQQLGGTIAGDTDRLSAGTHWRQIFTDYRVYAVAIPQAAYAAAADGLTEGALPALEKTYGALEAVLAASPAATPELEATLAHMRSELDAASSSVAGIADAVLAVTPAQWNSDPAVLADERAALGSATASAAAAADDAATIIEALQ